MANFGSVLNIGKNLSKARKRVKSSSLFGKGRSVLDKVKGKVNTGLSKIKGRSLLPNTKLLEPIRPDLKEGGVRRILLDNFDYKSTKEAVKIISNKYEVESSGGITEKNIQEYAKCGVDFISIGAITHSISNFDLSLKAI